MKNRLTNSIRRTQSHLPLIIGRASVCLSFVGAVACSSTAPGPSNDGLESKRATAVQALEVGNVWAMENASAWSVVTGTATKQLSNVHSQGNHSLSVAAPAYVALRGSPVSKPTSISSLLGLDVMIPTQAGPYYYGAIQIMVTAPSLNVYSAWVGQMELGIPTGVWQTLHFTIPDNIYAQLLNNSFDDLAVTIALNPPSGLRAPFLLDNLSFQPVPGCVNTANGTLCDDVTACTTGTTCNTGVCGTKATPACDPGNDVLGFENYLAWRGTVGTPALTPSSTHEQGQRSLSVVTRNFATINSIPLATLHKVSQHMGLWVQLPTSQPNPYWYGDITLNLNVPSLGISYSGNKSLTGLATGTWVELNFDLPANVYQLLATRTYSDLTFSISVNPPYGQTGGYLLDDLHFQPVASCTGVLNNTACEDNSLCTDGDACLSGVCGTPVVCNDNNVCTNDSCNPATGCVFTNNTLACSDGNACTISDSCSNSACVGGPPPNCDDGSGCTNDSCNPASGCVNQYACQADQTCTNNACCSPKTCADAHIECGSADNGCGGTVACGTCPSGAQCNPAGRCIPIGTYDAPMGVNVCEKLLEELIIPPTFEDVLTCKDYAWYECGTIVTPDCCTGLCILNPICTFPNPVKITEEIIMHPGDIYCDVTMTPSKFIEALARGQIQNLNDIQALALSGGLVLLLDLDTQILAQAGRYAPGNVQDLIRALTQPVYDGGSTGFAYADMEGVKIVSSSLPTAGMYLPGDRLAITLGPVIVLRSDLYDAVFSANNSNVSYADFLTNSSVDSNFIKGVDTLIHEFVHVKQYRLLGQNGFYTQYLVQAIGSALGGSNAFEQEAYAYEISLTELQGGRWCEVMKDQQNGQITAFNVPVPPVTCN